ncbi:hypothetical protein BH20ACI2_BH20ACI2_23430 [soil metagenome]
MRKWRRMPSILSTLEKLNSFSELPSGWNFGSGEPIARNVKINCSSIILMSYSLGLEDTDVFPGPEGDVQLNVYKGEATLELIFETDGTVSVSLDDEDHHRCLGRSASVSEVSRYLKEFQNDQCPSSVYSTFLTIMTREGEGSRASRSGRPAMGAAYQSSNAIVRRSTAELSALTSERTTRARQALQSSSGQYHRSKSRTSATSSTA